MRCVDSRSDLLEINYRRRNGENVIAYVLISFHSRDVLCTLSRRFVRPDFSFVLCLFGCSLFGCLFEFREFNYAKFNANGNGYNGCGSVRYNSLFISLPLFTKSHKTTT